MQPLVNKNCPAITRSTFSNCCHPRFLGLPLGTAAYLPPPYLLGPLALQSEADDCSPLWARGLSLGTPVRLTR